MCNSEIAECVSAMPRGLPVKPAKWTVAHVLEGWDGALGLGCDGGRSGPLPPPAGLVGARTRVLLGGARLTVVLGQLERQRPPRAGLYIRPGMAPARIVELESRHDGVDPERPRCGVAVVG